MRYLTTAAGLGLVALLGGAGTALAAQHHHTRSALAAGMGQAGRALLTADTLSDGGTATATATSAYDRNCGGPNDGWLVGDNNASTWPDEVNGPWHINMMAGQDRAINASFPPQEFGWHIPLSGTGCLVAEGVAESASNAWYQNWSSDDGSVNATAGTSGGLVHLGHYYCTGVHNATNTRLKETCARVFLGHRMAASFVIQPNPNPASN
jgi:hypothetical protein